MSIGQSPRNTFSEAQRAAIARDCRPYREIAEAFGAKYSYVRVIKQRAGISGTKKNPNRGVKKLPKPPMPDRHYRVDWDAPL